jgi:conjugative relaxase-like TrwC/TraI family protein
MISIGKITSVEQAVRYLREAVADQQLEYYTARGESPGRWSGRGADALGLHGEVSDADFTAVLSGKHPSTGENLGRHWANQRIAAFDVAVSAPKDVSILYALGDEGTRATILRIHREGVEAAAEYLQDHAAWARQFNPETGKTEPVRARLVMPEFLHRTARPVTDPSSGSVTVDPQLHTHMTVPNWAQRPDGTWGQLHSEPLYRHAAAAGAIAQAEWRDRLVRELGVSTVVDGNGCFSIVGITEAQRREFSRRSLQIEAMEHSLDLDSRRSREVATLDTRESKHCIPASEDLFARWSERAAAVGLDGSTLPSLFHREAAALAERSLDLVRPAEIVGVRGLTAQAATFTRRDLLRAVAAHAPLGMSRLQLEVVADRILADSASVVPLVPPALEGETDAQAVLHWTETARDVRYTTPEMVALEQRMLHTARQRSNAGLGVSAPEHIAAAIEVRPTLTADQRLMIETVCGSPAGVVVVEGAAGVGKTFALDGAREAFDASGVRAVGCALAGRAAQGLEQGSAIPSWTVSSMLNELQIEQLPLGGVLVVDEAGMIGDRQLAELMELAARDSTKLVLVGDPKQLQPIDAGAPLRTLGDHIGKVTMTENVRQVAAWERAALALMRDADAHRAYQQYTMRDRIHVEPSATERRAAIVADHRELAAHGVDAVMLARRRDEVTALNEMARAAAIADGRVLGPALEVSGQEYQAGDQIICVANDRRGGVTNGTRGLVIGVDVERRALNVQRSDGRELVIDTQRYDAIDRGYALTVHKAQGMTADVALVMGSDGATREWAYTAMSRSTLATHYYEVAHPRERDSLGVHHSLESELSADERILRTWSRSEQKDSALDYPQRYVEAERDVVAAGLDSSPTDAQRELLAHLGAPELAEDATWIDASLEIDRRLGNEPGSRLGVWLQEIGYSDGAVRALVQSAAVAHELEPEALRHERTLAATVESIQTLSDDPLLEDPEFDLGFDLEPSVDPGPVSL